MPLVGWSLVVNLVVVLGDWRHLKMVAAKSFFDNEVVFSAAHPIHVFRLKLRLTLPDRLLH